MVTVVVMVVMVVVIVVVVTVINKHNPITERQINDYINT